MARCARGNCKIVGRKFASNGILRERKMKDGLLKGYQRIKIVVRLELLGRPRLVKICGKYARMEDIGRDALAGKPLTLAHRISQDLVERARQLGGALSHIRRACFNVPLEQVILIGDIQRRQNRQPNGIDRGGLL